MLFVKNPKMNRHFSSKGHGRRLWDRTNIFCLLRLPWLMSFFIGTVIFIFLGNLMTSEYGRSHVRTSSFTRWLTFDLKSHNALSMTVPPYQEPLPNMDAKQIRNILKTVDDFVSPFIDKLINIRTIHMKNLQREQWTPLTDTTELVDADSHTFLSQIRNLKILQTITINISLDDFLTKLPFTGYDYGGNNCRLIEAKSEYGNSAPVYNGGYGRKYYNSSCQGNVTSLIRQVPFEKSMLDIGYYPFLRPKRDEVKEVVALTYLHVTQNAIVTSDGDVFVSNFKVVPQRCMAGKHTEGRPEDEEILPLYEEVFAIAQFWGEGFYHFMNEELPRIAAWVPFLRHNPTIRIQVQTWHHFIPPVFQALGLSPERIVSGDVRAQLLYIPAGTPCGAPTYFNSRLMSLRLQENVINKPSEFNFQVQKNDLSFNGRNAHNDSNDVHQVLPQDLAGNFKKSSRNYVIVIKRSSKRYFVYHEEIYQELVNLTFDYDLKVRLFDDQNLPSYKDTVEMFHNAVVIIGPHGAGLSNMFYAQPGTVVLEGLCYHEDFANLCYRNLAKNLGLRYYGVLLPDDCLDMKPIDLLLPLKQFLTELKIATRRSDIF